MGTGLAKGMMLKDHGLVDLAGITGKISLDNGQLVIEVVTSVGNHPVNGMEVTTPAGIRPANGLEVMSWMVHCPVDQGGITGMIFLELL